MKSQQISLGIQNFLNKCLLALMKSPPFLMVFVLEGTRHKADIPQATLSSARASELPVLVQPVELPALVPTDACPCSPQGQAQGQAPGHFSRQPPSASISPGLSCTFCPTSFQGTPLQCSTVLVQPRTTLHFFPKAFFLVGQGNSCSWFMQSMVYERLAGIITDPDVM